MYCSPNLAIHLKLDFHYHPHRLEGRQKLKRDEINRKSQFEIVSDCDRNAIFTDIGWSFLNRIHFCTQFAVTSFRISIKTVCLYWNHRVFEVIRQETATILIKCKKKIDIYELSVLK